LTVSNAVVYPLYITMMIFSDCSSNVILKIKLVLFFHTGAFVDCCWCLVKTTLTISIRELYRTVDLLGISIDSKLSFSDIISLQVNDKQLVLCNTYILSTFIYNALILLDVLQ